MLGVALEVAIGSVDGPVSAQRYCAEQVINGTSGDAMGPACVADLRCSFIVSDLKSHVRKKSQLLLQSDEFLRSFDAG